VISLPPDLDQQFPSGQIVATPNVLANILPEDIRKCLVRHFAGDWGECSEEDIESNNLALVDSGRLFSIYRSVNNVRFWIITEADRSATTVLLPEDY